MPQPLADLVQDVADLLSYFKARIVFAESCTAGLVSASLARVAGISDFHCGSAVVYRYETKTQWLGVSKAMLIDPGPVSEEVARAMAVGVLERTSEAELAAAITGHLGPNAPHSQDGLIYIGIATKTAKEPEVAVFRHVLPAEMIGLAEARAASLREWRQWKAVEHVLTHVRDCLATRHESPGKPH